MSTTPDPKSKANVNYEDPANPVLPVPGMRLDLARAALVIIDPQVDFLSEDGVAWPFVGRSVVENGVIDHLGQLFDAAKKAGIEVAVSPHY